MVLIVWTDMKRQTKVSAYLKIKQLLLFKFLLQRTVDMEVGSIFLIRSRPHGGVKPTYVWRFLGEYDTKKGLSLLVAVDLVVL